MDWQHALGLIEYATPAWNRMKEDQKRIDLFYRDWNDAIEAAKKLPDGEDKAQRLAVLFGIPTALAMKMPTGFSFDPFKAVRLLADDFARALNFTRYKDRRNL